jgi:hypothetical protein
VKGFLLDCPAGSWEGQGLVALLVRVRLTVMKGVVPKIRLPVSKAFLDPAKVLAEFHLLLMQLSAWATAGEEILGLTLESRGGGDQLFPRCHKTAWSVNVLEDNCVSTQDGALETTSPCAKATMILKLSCL